VRNTTGGQPAIAGCPLRVPPGGTSRRPPLGRGAGRGRGRRPVQRIQQVGAARRQNAHGEQHRAGADEERDVRPEVLGARSTVVSSETSIRRRPRKASSPPQVSAIVRSLPHAMALAARRWCPVAGVRSPAWSCTRAAAGCGAHRDPLSVWSWLLATLRATAHDPHTGRPGTSPTLAPCGAARRSAGSRSQRVAFNPRAVLFLPPSGACSPRGGGRSPWPA
jgi:hypothetical protein